MTAAPRYALYFAPPPESALWQFGSSVLGYDAATGLDVEQFVPSGFTPAEWRQFTEEPRRYGFHATLKAPFRLADGLTEADLVEAVAASVASTTLVELVLSVVRLGDFIALAPPSPPLALAALEAAVVTTFDRFRTPLEDWEYAKRLRSPLTPRQRQQLEQLGYPYVLGDFRFHMTLSSRLPSDRMAAAVGPLRDAFALRCPSTATVDRLAIFRADEARFRMLVNLPFAKPPHSLLRQSPRHPREGS